MIAGISGQLVASTCLEARIGSRHDPREAPATERRKLEQWRTRCSTLGPASSLRALFDVGAVPLMRALGFGTSFVDASDDYLVARLSTVRGSAALLVAPWAGRLDSFWRTSVVEARRLGSRWALVFNGSHLRVLDAGRLFARRHLEFDLDLAVDDDRTCAAFWATVSADALTGDDMRSPGGLSRLVTASDAYAAGVCGSLRDGVLNASADVLDALVGRRRADLDAAFDQALTIVYRILFLLFAEARGLVPMWHPVYRESYSIDGLRRAAERGRVSGLWDGLRAVGRLAHAGCRTGDLTVTAFNGRLFDQTRLPLAERRDLDDEAARRTLLALTSRWSPHRQTRERIAYGDLGVEQLGAVYETLLDYVPRRRDRRDDHPTVECRPRGGDAPPPHTRTSHRTSGETSHAKVELEAGSGIRKATGTFYTPQAIARYVVRETLGPLVHGRSAAEILALRVLDPAMGSGAFLVEAGTFLSQAYEDALIAGGECVASDVGPRERAAIRRRVAECCLFGVDINPMAVQLARLSLWLATLAHDRPLSFFDHHLRAGDSLLGAWISDLARSPRAGWRPPNEPTLFDPAEAETVLRSVVPLRFTLEAPNETVDAVRDKERALARLERRDSELSKWKRVADLWCATWIQGRSAAPASAFKSLADAVLAGTSDLPPTTVNALLERAAAVTATHRFFHWELEFPEAFFDANGRRLATAGFDAVLGNPPWDMMRADWGTADARRRARDDGSGVMRFVRESGVYRARARGHVNRYQLFVERIVALVKAGGRFGLVLPSGLATDQGSDEVRRLLFSRCAVDGLVGFENRRGVFPVHRSVTFLLVTGTAGSPSARIGLRLGEVDPAVLESKGLRDEPWFPLHVSRALLERMSGDGLAVPALKAPIDLVIAERAAARFAPLGHPAGWGAQFGRELNASDDRDVLQAPGRAVAIIEGKHIDPFRVRVREARHSADSRAIARRLGTRHLRPRLAYRDVASATNRQTLIAALLPAGCASTHTVFCLRSPMRLAAQYALCGLFNSLVVNYLARLRVMTHVTTAIVERLPIPRPDDSPAAFREIAALARRLGRGWSSEASARLNALVASLYQLSTDELAHVLDSFPLVPREERDRVSRAFADLGAR